MSATTTRSPLHSGDAEARLRIRSVLSTRNARPLRNFGIPGAVIWCSHEGVLIADVIGLCNSWIHFAYRAKGLRNILRRVTKDHALELEGRSDQQWLAYLQIHSWRVFLRLPATDSSVEQSDGSYSA